MKLTGLPSDPDGPEVDVMKLMRGCLLAIALATATILFVGFVLTIIIGLARGLGVSG